MPETTVGAMKTPQAKGHGRSCPQYCDDKTEDHADGKVVRHRSNAVCRYGGLDDLPAAR